MALCPVSGISASRANEQKAARAADAADQKTIANVYHLRALTDDELIAGAQARTSLSHPYHEMEMQRRLKDAILAQTAETTRGRIWGAWGTAVIAVLTIVVIVLTVVLVKHG
jgi:hypothetical protein